MIAAIGAPQAGTRGSDGFAERGQEEYRKSGTGEDGAVPTVSHFEPLLLLR